MSKPKLTKQEKTIGFIIAEVMQSKIEGHPHWAFDPDIVVEIATEKCNRIAMGIDNIVDGIYICGPDC